MEFEFLGFVVVGLSGLGVEVFGLWFWARGVGLFAVSDWRFDLAVLELAVKFDLLRWLPCFFAFLSALAVHAKVLAGIFAALARLTV